MNYKIDNLQYCNWSREVFEINREAELDAVHVTIVYHEDYDELLKRVDEWNIHFKDNSDLIRKKWIKLNKEHHPDNLISKGLPQEFIDQANQELSSINLAYDKIKKQRGTN